MSNFNEPINKATPTSVERHFIPEPNTGCWLWSARWVNGNGYGRVKYRGEVWMAHRLIYTLYKGSIPEGLELDHLCRQRLCVNPDHLEPVSHSENAKRGLTGRAVGDAKLARTHCLQGHAYAGNNLKFTKQGARRCRTCTNIIAARSRAQRS